MNSGMDKIRSHAPNLTMHEQGVPHDSGLACAEFGLGTKR